ncbi:hypothetical protein CANCADRAFT_3845 [Tortispora caseinolytica NRRL Y-17796]|uniref:EF-hand domain-containing protein n=1 Tax=Tortispora caseinolytica NRRL Y-17796 TaxID=767744 RepID=A0A1E4TBT7_9ASCO|nr:hypothetical protein CANCADRAFT_3845 [Tortispora caseinolytica NRRL Y-17796]
MGSSSTYDEEAQIGFPSSPTEPVRDQNVLPTVERRASLRSRGISMTSSQNRNGLLRSNSRASYVSKASGTSSVTLNQKLSRYKSRELQNIEEEDANLYDRSGPGALGAALAISEALNDKQDAEGNMESTGAQQHTKAPLKVVTERDMQRTRLANARGGLRFILRAGQMLDSFMAWSFLTRMFSYWFVGFVIIFFPLAMGMWGFPYARLGGVLFGWICVWIIVSWTSIWVSRVFMRYLPTTLRFILAIVLPKYAKYAILIQSIENPAALFLTLLCTFITYNPLLRLTPGNDHIAEAWVTNLGNVLASLLITSALYLAEQIYIQYISVSFHKRQFATRIAADKQKTKALINLLSASYYLYPQFDSKFYDIDVKLTTFALERSAQVTTNTVRRVKNALPKLSISANDTQQRNNSSSQNTSSGSESDNSDNKNDIPLESIEHASKDESQIPPEPEPEKDRSHSPPFWARMSVTPNAVVANVLEKRSLVDDFCQRVWNSLVEPGEESIQLEDLHEVLGEFDDQVTQALDSNGSGDINLEELTGFTRELCQSKKSMMQVLTDTDLAIERFNSVLRIVVGVIGIFIMISLVSPDLSTVLTTTATSLLALSFMFTASAQEFISSCIFVFVQHPLDAGDHLVINGDHLEVLRMELLFTVFKRLDNNQVTQLSNAWLSRVWIDNVTRSKGQTDIITISLDQSVDAEKRNLLEKSLKDFVMENPRLFKPEILLEMTGITTVGGYNLQIRAFHKNNFSDYYSYNKRKNMLMDCIVNSLRTFDIRGPGGYDAVMGEDRFPMHIVRKTSVNADNKVDVTISPAE